MGPLDLTKAAPRAPREALDGLIFMPRTIDKLRASQPGGNLGDYGMSGFSEMVLEKIGVKADDLAAAVAQAKSDDDVAAWLREHADTGKYAEANTMLEGRVVKDDAHRERLAAKYPVMAREPGMTSLLDMLEADDRDAFAAGSAR